MENERAIENLRELSDDLYRSMLQSRDGTITIPLQLARQIDYVLAAVIMAMREWKKEEAIQ